MKDLKIIDVRPENVLQEALFCVKDTKNPAFACKRIWFIDRFKEGLRLKILKNLQDKQLAFIEYVPAEFAWRPVHAPNFMFVHCMFVYARKDKGQGYGSYMLNQCISDAKSRNMSGVVVMTSKGSWITDKRLFENNGFKQVDKIGRFELMSKKFDTESANPTLIDWTSQWENYKGWHILYADQCPWHQKSVAAIKAVTEEMGIKLKIKKITSHIEAKNAPSGFGVFSLMFNGKLLADHYISETRFRNILKKEIQL